MSNTKLRKMMMFDDFIQHHIDNRGTGKVSSVFFFFFFLLYVRGNESHETRWHRSTTNSGQVGSAKVLNLTLMGRECRRRASQFPGILCWALGIWPAAREIKAEWERREEERRSRVERYGREGKGRGRGGEHTPRTPPCIYAHVKKKTHKHKLVTGHTNCP